MTLLERAGQSTFLFLKGNHAGKHLQQQGSLGRLCLLGVKNRGKKRPCGLETKKMGNNSNFFVVCFV